MKNTIWKMLLVVCATLTALSAMSCDDEPTVDRLCHVTLVCNADLGAEGDTLEFDVMAETLLTGIPELTREGFGFAGWYTDQSTANNKNPEAVIAYPAHDLTKMPIYLDVTLYGRWITVIPN